MAATALPSAQCLKHSALFGAFWERFNVSLVMFIISTFVIPGLIVLLALIFRDIIRGQPPRHPSTDHDNPEAILTVDRGAAPSAVARTSHESTPRKPQRTMTFKWVVSTILLASAASHSAFQILLFLYARYCLGVYMNDIAYMCFDAAVGTTIVLVTRWHGLSLP